MGLHGNRFEYYDTAYGNLYSIDRNSLEDILRAKKIPAKEIANKNVKKIKLFNKCYPLVIFLKTPLINRPGRVEKETNPFLSFPSLRLETASDAHSYVRPWLHLVSKFIDYFGEGVLEELSAEDAVNKSGYDVVAPFFSDEQRVTTKAFHELSFKLWAEKIPQLQGKVLEVGPGNGWLRKTFSWPDVQYNGVDISAKMISLNPDKKAVEISSLSDMSFSNETFDAIVGSLIDPCFSPQNLPHIHRSLKVGGKFIGTVPASEWASLLRKKRGFAARQTKFSTPQGDATVQSYCFTGSQIYDLLLAMGFKDIKVTSITSNASNMLPPDILNVVNDVGSSVPIIHAWECYK